MSIFYGIDRSYDDIRDPQDRLDATLRVLDGLAHPPNSRRTMEILDRNQERVAFNQRFLTDELKQRLYADADASVTRWASAG